MAQKGMWKLLFLKDYNKMMEMTLGNKKVTWPKKECHIRNRVSMLQKRVTFFFSATSL
jgi:hypothetical protein